MEPLYKSEVSSLEGLIDSLAKRRELYAPTSTRTQSEFSRVDSIKSANLNLVNVIKSPKFQLLPQSIEMFTYDPRSGSATLSPEAKFDAIFYGVRPCDASAIGVLDLILLSGRYEDPYYASRRQGSLIVSIACEQQEQTCFCKDLGTGPVEGIGGDIALLKDSGIYYAKPVSAKGLDFMECYSDIFNSATGDDVNSYERMRSQLEGAMSSKLKADALKKSLRSAYESQLWSSISERCIGCGICSFFCPTCYCFDTIDEYRSNICRRIRGWDSCSNCDFSRMAGGLDPRPTKDKRFRHRTFHKWSYILEAFNVNACVGCGRCISLCPVNIDIREVLESL